MPKMKTKRAAAKRFKGTATGKIRRRKAYARHLLSCKSAKQKRNLNKSTILTRQDVRIVRTCLPYL